VQCSAGVLDWDGLGFSFHVHGQEFNSFHRATRSKTLRGLPLRPRETFLTPVERSICGNGSCDFWTRKRQRTAMCIGRQGPAPSEHCGGLTACRLLLKRQKEGDSMRTPAQVESLIGMYLASDPKSRDALPYCARSIPRLRVPARIALTPALRAPRRNPRPPIWL
jgi:hypothetical protein